MKILLVSPFPTHPLSAGNRARVAMLAKILQEAGHEVRLGLVPMAAGDMAATEIFFRGKITVFPYRPTKAHQGWRARIGRRILQELGSLRAYVWAIDDWFDHQVCGALEDLHAREQFDAVIVVYVFMSKVLEAIPDSVLKVIDTNDRFTDRHMHYISAGQRAPIWFSTTEAEERRGLARAHIVLAIQEEEGKLFQHTLQGTNTKVVTVGHMLPVSEPLQLARGPCAVFVGSNNTINQDAVRYFAREVLPRVRAAEPKFELWLVGDICNVLEELEGVVMRGRVAELADVYVKGSMAVNPVRMGTGLNVKTVECLALGLPLVVSETGSRGLEAFRKTAFVTVKDNDSEGMAAAVIAFLQDAELAEKYARQAHEAAHLWNRAQRENFLQLFNGHASK